MDSKQIKEILETKKAKRNEVFAEVIDLKRKELELEEIEKEILLIENSLGVIGQLERQLDPTLAVNNGECPFPRHCNQRKQCTLSVSCGADVVDTRSGRVRTQPPWPNTDIVD